MLKMLSVDCCCRGKHNEHSHNVCCQWSLSITIVIPLFIDNKVQLTAAGDESDRWR